MVKPFVRRPVSWTLLVGLLILVFALSACGGDSGTAATASPTTQPTTPASTTTTITIREQTGGQDVYTFDPQSVTIKAGQSVTFNNLSDEFHQLILTDAAGNSSTAASPFTANTIVPTSRTGITNTTLVVVFPTAGTYYYTSKLVNRLTDGAHPEGALSKGKGTIIVS